MKDFNKKSELVEFADRLRTVTAALGVSHQGLATDGGITPQTFTAYVRGDSQPTMSTLARWLKKHRINLNWLCAGEGEMFLPGDPGEPAPTTLAQSVPPGTDVSLDHATLHVPQDLIAQRVQTVSRVMREAGASPESIQEAVFLALEGRPRKTGYASGEHRRDYPSAAEDAPPYAEEDA